MLLSSGGNYEHVSSGSGAQSATSSNSLANWQYVGGETRLVAVARTNSFSEFLQQLSRAATTSVWDEVSRGGYLSMALFTCKRLASPLCGTGCDGVPTS